MDEPEHAGWRTRLRTRMTSMRRDVAALIAALGHPRTPWYAKVWIGLVVAYAVSPIDLIPDPIPVLGLLDDAVLIPLGVLVAIRLVPDDVFAECRARAVEPASSRLRRVGMLLVAATWLVLLVAAGVLARRWWRG